MGFLRFLLLLLLGLCNPAPPDDPAACVPEPEPASTVCAREDLVHSATLTDTTGAPRDVFQSTETLVWVSCTTNACPARFATSTGSNCTLAPPPSFFDALGRDVFTLDACDDALIDVELDACAEFCQAFDIPLGNLDGPGIYSDSYGNVFEVL